MDFKLVIKFLIESFNRKGLDFALIGGVALQAQGVSRTTRQEMSDIKLLLKRNKKILNSGIVREYFNLFGKEEELDNIILEIKNA